MHTPFPAPASSAPFPSGALLPDVEGDSLSARRAGKAGRALPASGHSFREALRREAAAWRREAAELARFARHVAPFVRAVIAETAKNALGLAALILFALGFPLGLAALFHVVLS